jgi:glycosyltransferase involved in cell wall biosynthesis
LRAFALARRRDPRLRLLVKTSRADNFPADSRAFARLLRQVPGVLWQDGEWSNAEIEALLVGSAAYLSLHRSEGFGRNIARAMLLGTPAVTTDYSGNADLGTDPLYFGVRWSPRAVRAGEYVGGEGQVWAEPDSNHAARQLVRAVRARAPAAMAARRLRLGRNRFARDLLRALDLAPGSPGN